MNKKDYQKPTMNVVKIQQQAHLLSGSVTGTSNNAELNFTGEGNGGPFRARQRGGFDDWDDWDEE